MAALSGFAGKLFTAANWRNEARLWAAACAPVARVCYAGILAIALGITLSGAVTAFLLAFQLHGKVPAGQTSGSTWVDRQVDKNEARLDAHDRQIAQTAKDLAVIERRVVESDEFRRSLEAMHISDRLAQLEAHIRTGIYLLGFLLSGVGALLVELFTRRILKG